MSVDRGGTWWRGSAAEDIETYLIAYSRRTSAINAYRVCICPCGGKTFLLDGDPREGFVRRECLKCGTKHFLADSEENWESAGVVRCRCVECQTEPHQAGLGFALDPRGEVSRLFVGVRCFNCGILACFATWPVGYVPSKHLLDLA